jgi:hypothetical protein
MMYALGKVLCAIGIHDIDTGRLWDRKLRAARMGVNVAGGLPCQCRRCGRGVWL